MNKVEVNWGYFLFIIKLQIAISVQTPEGVEKERKKKSNLFPPSSAPVEHK